MIDRPGFDLDDLLVFAGHLMTVAMRRLEDEPDDKWSRYRRSWKSSRLVRLPRQVPRVTARVYRQSPRERGIRRAQS